MNIQKEYKYLYKTILEIGKSRVNNGVSYSELLSTLKEMGFVIDGCSKLAISKFFCDNFYHLPSKEKDKPTPENLATQHCGCNFVMTGEACLYLERLNELDQLKKDSKFNFNLAMSAIIIGLVGAFAGNWPDWDAYLKQNNEEKLPKQIPIKSYKKQPTISPPNNSTKMISK